jgi:signal peptidase
MTNTASIVSRCELVAEVARTCGEVRLKLFGTSMVPALWPGDLATIEHTSMARLRPGDIVLFVTEGALTVHRVRRIEHGRLIAQGDSHAHLDPPVIESAVIGRVVNIVRNGRKISLHRSIAHRAGSFLLRRSELFRRVVLRVGSAPWSRSPRSVLHRPE